MERERERERERARDRETETVVGARRPREATVSEVLVEGV